MKVTPENRFLRLHHGDFTPPDGNDDWSTRVTPDDDTSLFETVATRYNEDVIVHGHSHCPFKATPAGTTFVNPGSIGLQRDGWPVNQAHYALLEDGKYDLRKVMYDTETVTADSGTMGSPYKAKYQRDPP